MKLLFSFWKLISKLCENILRLCKYPVPYQTLNLLSLCGLMFSYFIQLLIILYYQYLFLFSNCLRFDQCKPHLIWSLFPLERHPSCFEHFIIFWLKKMNQSCTFPAPALETAVSPRSPGSFWWGMVFRNEVLATTYTL